MITNAYGWVWHMRRAFAFYWPKQDMNPNLTQWVGKYTTFGINKIEKYTFLMKNYEVVHNLFYRKNLMIK